VVTENGWLNRPGALGHAFVSTAMALMVSVPAFAQTANLTVAKDSTIRGGSYATTKHGSDAMLATRASSDATYVRRAALTFDTETTIPDNATIQSATLVLTVRGGNAETRQLRAYGMPVSFDEPDVTWNARKSGVNWTHAGGDTTGSYAAGTVTGVVGSQVGFNVTQHVQNVILGQYGSRYARFLVVDTGGSSRDSYKEYHSRESTETARQPRLIVTYGSSVSAPAPAPSPSTSGSTSSTLKVFDWNIHHGVGTDGVYDIDRIAAWIAKSGANVVSLNEVEKYTGWGNEDQPARFAALLKAKTGSTWTYNFATRDGNTNGQGNLLLTTLPIDSTADHLLSYTRSVAQIRVTVNGRTINLFSTHLDADSSSRRAAQIQEVKSWMSTFPEQRIVAGDFNAWPGATEITGMTSSYYDTWAVAKANGTAVAYSGNEAGNTRNSRIDYIFQSKGATSLVVKASQVFDTRNSSGAMPSDHRPVMTTFEVR
jgi:endonuclease/exonuclease/phosphatase family metal-dependent hydrolase